MSEPMSPDELAILTIATRMHTAYLEHERLNEIDAPGDMFAHIEMMADQLDRIRDDVPALHRAVATLLAGHSA